VKFIAGLLLCAAAIFAAAGQATALDVPVQSLRDGDFAASNTSVTKTPDGVHFGVYADAGRHGGALVYSWMQGALNENELSELETLAYTYRYSTSNHEPNAAPYLRIDLRDADGEPHRVTFDPTQCGTVAPPEDTDVTAVVSAEDENESHPDEGAEGEEEEADDAARIAARKGAATGAAVLYDRERCESADQLQPWADVVAAHGSETVTAIAIAQGNTGAALPQGFSAGLDASALVRELTVNTTHFAFDMPPFDGVRGPMGREGAPGAPGAAGAPGTTTVVTRVVREVVVAPSPARQCRGNTRRTLSVPRRRGQRLLSARARLDGWRVPVRGRRVIVDLRNRSEGNYNVHITSRHRTARGKVRTVRTMRTLSVACW
jgi:hypothetical protein